MKGSLWKLAFVAMLATGVVHGQQNDNNSQSRVGTRVGTPQKAQQPPSDIPDSGSANLSATKMDTADLQIRIQQAFAQDPSLANYNLGAYVSVDKVSLAGTVKRTQDKAAAQGIAESIAKGLAVDNEIRVASSPNYINRPNTSTSVWPSGTGTSPAVNATSSSDTATHPSKTPPPR